MDDKVRQFLEKNHAAAMVTLKKDGTPHAVRVSIALVNGKLWSSGTQTRMRTKYLRRDPRCTLCVFEQHGGGWLGLETRVAILEGPDAPVQNLWLHRITDGEPPDVEKYLREKVDQQRLIYEFEITKAYGQY
jgi:PPOX class probable F420-dependent enzyme